MSAVHRSVTLRRLVWRALPLAPMALASLPLLGWAPVHAAAAFDIAASTPPRLLALDYFGSHFHRLRIPPQVRSPLPQTTWPMGVVGTVRLWDSGTRWADIEPASGRFDFTQLDYYVAQAEAHAATVMLVLGSTPGWASARPNEPCPYGRGCLAEPADLQHWDRYVEAVARRYAGRIALYELWNEPYFSDFPKDRGHPGAFFSGSAASMVELARRTRAVLDRVSPSAVLLTPGFTGATDRLELFLAQGGARHVSGVAYHFYVDNDPDFVALYRDVRTVMQRHGLGSQPLYNTESGFEVGATDDAAQPAMGVPRFDEAGAAAQLASSLVLGAFLGLQGYYQYAWDNTRMGLLRPDGRSPTASLHAFTRVQRWLSGASLLGCSALPQGLQRCNAQRDGLHAAVLWRPGAGRGLPLEVPAAAEVVALENAVSGPVMPASAAASRLPAPSIDIGAAPVVVWSRTPWHVPALKGRAP